MASSAAEFRQRFPRRGRTITIPVPDTDLTIECRRPDLAQMVISGFMQWPALQRVREIVSEQSESLGADVIDNRPLPTIVDHAKAVGEMLDQWVCIAAVSPRVVLTEAEQVDDAVCVLDLPYDVRLAIFNATFNIAAKAPAKTAGADFRGDEPGGAPPGSGGEAVRDAPLELVGHQG